MIICCSLYFYSFRIQILQYLLFILLALFDFHQLNAIYHRPINCVSHKTGIPNNLTFVAHAKRLLQCYADNIYIKL